MKQKQNRFVTLLREIWKAKYLYLLLIPFLAWLIMFSYVPMSGVVLAFKKFNARLGIWGSEWIGLKHFQRIFITPAAVEAIKNTITLSLQRIFWEFPAPILMALLITELRGDRLKKVYQTIFTFPHFISWVVVSQLLTVLFSDAGGVNMLLSSLGFDKIAFLADGEFFKSMLFITANWKEMGWAAIVYMAAIAGIDPTLYEAASIDGATRLKQIWHITLSSLKPIIAIQFILKVGGIMNAGFSQIFNMRNAAVKSAVQIIDSYIYDITFGAKPDYGFSTAVGLFKSLINFALLLFANWLVGRMTGEKMFSFKKEKVKKEVMK
ncbi:MAG: sugar ABC transporter permease [Lachnospiraceae bacterium]|nr:sugar ABC transporter permease [Lachnospiraceae bacterium]